MAISSTILPRSTMEYGAAYTRPQRNSDEDGAPMLRDTQYQPYRSDHRRHSSDAVPASSQWIVSPIVQPATPLMPPTNDAASAPSPILVRAALDAPYQEPAAWEYSIYTNVNDRPSREGPKLKAHTSTTSISDTGSLREPRRYFRHPRHIPEPWISGFWIRFPWLGFAAIFFIVMLTGASASILLASEGSSPDHWRIGSVNTQPSVYISIFEMITNLLTVFTLMSGLAIKFWRQLMRGTTLSALHDTYDSSFLWPAVRRLFRFQFNGSATACLLGTLSALRGPLLQRALTVETPINAPTVYRCNSTFIVIGVLLSVVGVAGIIPLYMGFWELGRSVSLNPLEIARAFGAPLLEGMEGNATPDMITIERGGMSVRYGALERFGMEKRLRVEETARATVRSPWQGEIFG